MSEAAALREALALAAEARMEDALARLGPHTASPAAALLAARCLLDRPDPLAALPLLERAAAEGGPRNERVDALRLLGRLRTGFGMDLRAAAAYRALLDLRPGDPEAMFLLGRALLGAGWPDQAVATLAALPRPLPDWWRQVAQDAARRLAAARAAARARLATDTCDPALVAALLAAGRLAGATAALRRLGQTPDAAWLGARLAERRAWPTPAAPPPALPARAAVATWLLAGGRADAARQALGDVAALDRPGRLTRARLLLLSGEAARLAEIAAADCAARPRRTDAARLLITALLQGGRLAVLRAEAMAPAAAAPEPVPLVQYWDRPDAPADVAAAMESWAAAHPGLPRLRFHRASARDWLGAHGGARAVQAFDACPNAAAESDLLRFAVLARQGGLWADADERCRRPWTGVLAALPPGGFAAEFSDEIPCTVRTGVLAVRPGGTLAAQAARKAIAALLRRASGAAFGVWEETGPGLVTRLVAAAPDQVRLIAPALFRHLTERAYDLAYKTDRGADWRP